MFTNRLIKFSSLVIMAFSFTFCEDDPKIANCLISTIKYGNDLTMTFTLAEDGKILTIKSDGVNSEVNTISYNVSGQIIKSASPSGVTEYFYTDNRITRSLEHDLANQTSHESSYKYNSYGQLDQVLFGNFGSSVLAPYNLYEYSDKTSKNPVLMKMYDKNNNLIGSVSYEFDNRKSPIANSNDLKNILIESFFENNVTKTTYTPVGGSSEVTTITYTFNDEGYPLSEIAKFSDNSTSTTTYSYNCK
jgi:hypothetical protein